MNRTSTKIIFTICTAFLLFFSAFFITQSVNIAYAEGIQEPTATATGACGAAATWELDSEGTLHIKGEGAISQYSYGTAPWYAYKDSIYSVIVDDSVTTISAGAFYGCNSLQEITLPFVGANETSAGYSGNFGYIFGYLKSSSWSQKILSNGASLHFMAHYGEGESDNFYEAPSRTASYDIYYYYVPSSITKVNITSAKKLAAGAFYDYNHITEINLNNEITVINDYAFKNCRKLDAFKLPNTMIYLGNYALSDCDALTDIEIPLEITIVPQYLFYDCDELVNVKLHSDITSIGDYAFYSCGNLKNIELPENLETIGNYAFTECALTKIIIPNNVTIVGDSAFALCNQVQTLIIGHSVKKICNNAFSGLSLVTSVIVPDSVSSVGLSAFYGCNSLQEITLPFVGANETSAGYSGNFGYIFGYLKSSSWSQKILSNGASLHFMAHYGEGESDNFYEAPSRTASYDIYYYYVPSSITKVNITSAKKLAAGAFYDYNHITEINLNNEITVINDYAFKNCGVVPSSEEDLVVSGDILIAYKGSGTNVVLPEGIELIAPRAFENNSTLSSVQLSDTVTWVGDYAFYNCTNAIIAVPKISGSLTLGTNAFTATGSVQYLDKSSYTNGNDTFYYMVDKDNNAVIVGCETTSVNITLPVMLGGYNVVAVGYRGMADCTTLVSATIPSNITKLDLYAFAGCIGIDTVTIPATCVYVGEYAFSGCSALTTVVIAEGVTYLGDNCFENCTSFSIKYVIILLA